MSPFRTVLLFAALSLPGLLVIPYQQLQLVPAAASYRLYVQVQGEERPPLLSEQLLVTPTENAVSGLSSLKKLSSSSSAYEGSLQLEFAEGTAMEAKRQELLALLRQVYPQLPAGTRFPLVSATDRAEHQQPLLQYLLRSPDNPVQMRQKLEQQWLPQVRLLPAAAEVSIRGVGQQQTKVYVEAQQARQLNLYPSAIAAQIRAANSGKLLPVGQQQLPARVASLGDR